MDDMDRLKHELRVTRGELARSRIETEDSPADVLDRLPYIPEREGTFPHLHTLSDEQLQAHIERLKQDITDLEKEMKE